MDYLFLALGAFALVSLAVWWFWRTPLPDDGLPWEAEARKKQSSSAARQPPPPPEEVVPEALRPSLRKLRSDMPMVARAGAEELGRSDHPDAVGFLVRSLGFGQRSVLFAVCEALVALRAHSAGPLRQAADAHPDPDVRHRAGLLLGEIERTERGEPPTPVEDLLPLSDDERDEMARDLTRD